MQFLPKHLQYSDTQNEMALDQLFETHAFIPFAFNDCYRRSVVEELVFRHIIIGELGKKFNFIGDCLSDNIYFVIALDYQIYMII